VYNGATLIGYRQVLDASAMQQEMIQHFGLGSATTVRVVVTFPDGKQKEVTGVTAGQHITIDTSGAAVKTEARNAKVGSRPELRVSPNPFNPSTQIELRIANPEPRISPSSIHNSPVVNLSIYNTAGILVKTLMNRAMAAGSHSLVWNAKGIPAGVYIARLSVGGQVFTKRLMLVK
jgi:hypothetical protein